MLLLSLLAAAALPAIQPTYSALAQPEGSVVSGPEGEEPSPTEEIPPTEAPTEVPAPTEPPIPTATNTDVPPTAEPSATDEPVLPAETATAAPTNSATTEPSSTPYKNFAYGDRFVTTARVNCRIGPSVADQVIKVAYNGEQGVFLEYAIQAGGHDWIKVQFLDAATTQCFLAGKYVNLVEAGYGVPPTITPTPSNTATSTVTSTATATETATTTLTPTVTTTPTETLTPTITLTPTETLTPTVTQTATVTNTPTNTLVATLTSTPTYRNIHVGDIVAANQSINCRTSSSTSGSVVRVLEKNERAVVLADPASTGGYWWSKIRPMGTSSECYVVAQYLDVIQAGGGVTPTVSGTVTTGGPYKVGDIIQTTVTVNLRTGPGTTNPVVKTISSKTTGTVMAGYQKVGNDDWIQVQFPTGNGWIAARYTQLVSGSSPGGPFAAGEKIVVTGPVNLRVAPSTSSTALGQLNTGNQGIALGSQSKVGSTTWVHVEFPLGAGWVSSAYLKKLSAVTPTVGPQASRIAVYLDCTSNPERVLITNTNSQSVKIISIGSIYKPSGAEPFSVGDNIGPNVTLSYLSGSAASGIRKLTSSQIFDDSAGSSEGVVVRTSLGDITANCSAVTSGEKWIEVNLTTQTMTVWRGSTVVSSSLVSTGKPGFNTPTGTFYISTKYPSVTMAACVNGECWNTPGVPWAMLFRAGGFYIHGAYWHNDFGKVRSHGCVNLPVPYAEWLYGWAPSGTRVWIHY